MTYRVVCLSDAPQARMDGFKAQLLPWGVLKGERLIAVFVEENKATAYAMRLNAIAREMGEAK